MVVGILAHVDAGKTTLSEALLYQTGQIRSLGRVDHKDTYLDMDIQEKERGITIFSKQARIKTGELCITLLDTPGHVDFSAEMERTLQVLDYAVLVISGTDGVQGHTRTLWRLLKHYNVPAFLFINKMDLEGADRDAVMEQLKSELGDGCVDFSRKMENGLRASDKRSAEIADTDLWSAADWDQWLEEIAMCDEKLLDSYMETGEIPEADIRRGIAGRKIFPCVFGSALKLEGVDRLLEVLENFMEKKTYPGDFAARVYKIGRDTRGNRLTYMKILGDSLKIKERIAYENLEEKADQIRLYSGDKFETCEEVQAGEVCAVTGLTMTYPGQGLGACEEENVPVLEPVLNYQVYLPVEVNPVEMFHQLKQLEEEDPQLHVVWKEELKEIHMQMMGQVQLEVLTRQIKDRFGVVVVFGPGNIVYKETVAKTVEGMGHFEPLRHYAEVHLLMESGETGSGIQVSSSCSEDVLDLNWQRLIATHIQEREHPGVLTGSALTDVKFTILTGRAHNKHTEGGDFRQATYRAIRQGLKSTECTLLEPYYAFTLEVPSENVGRAMTDLQQRYCQILPLEYKSGFNGDLGVLKGKGPVACLQDYMMEVHAYTRGMGHLTLELSGYDVCHNSEEVIEKIHYDSEEDTLNPTSSVFCGHGAGFLVPWNEVESYMHMPRVYDPDQEKKSEEGHYYEAEGNSFHAGNIPGRAPEEKKLSSWELDKELQQIYAREFGMSKEDVEDQERRRWMKKKSQEEKPITQKFDKKGNPIYPKKKVQEEYVIVDGYNVIFAEESLRELSKVNIDSARDKLLDLLGNYQGYKNCRMMVVFDAYKVKGNRGKAGKYYDLEVVYTKTDETADMYIEKQVHTLRDKYRVTVVTNDGLEQLTVMSQGALRMSASGLFEDMKRVARENIVTF